MKTGIWIDKQEANIITLQNDQHSMITINSEIDTKERFAGESKQSGRFGKQFVSEEKKKDHRENQQIHRYLEDVINLVKNSDEIVVFGPGEMKKEFEKDFGNHKDIAHKLIGIESADSMTHNQMVAWVKNYFN